MLVTGKYIFTGTAGSDNLIENGAVYIQGPTIVAIGPAEALQARYPDEEMIGSDEFIVLPGLINAHDHGRNPSAFQLGVADNYVELWLVALLGQRRVDPYLATLFAAIQLIEAGITTVLHSFYEPSPANYETTLAQVAQAYENAGVRAVLALGILDNSPVADLCQRLRPLLLSSVKARVTSFLNNRTSLTLADYLAIFRRWREADHTGAGRVRVILGPVSTHWCSDRVLVAINEEAQRSQAGIQAHVLETRYQHDRAWRRYHKSAIAHLADIGFLSPLLSCAHCVWVTNHDIERLAETGTAVVHNPSSNLRLGSGIAPVQQMVQQGVNVALGLDSHTLNDDADLLQELRLAAYLPRVSGPRIDPLPAGRLLAMVTSAGARALGLGNLVGTLEPGKRADLILMRLDRINYPYLDPRQPILDGLVCRAKAGDVDTVIIDGQMVMRRRQLLTVDKEAVVSDLKDQLSRAPAGELDWLAQALKPGADSYFSLPFSLRERNLG